MTWEIVFRKSAQKEFDAAVAWYEKEKEGLGNEFAECVQEQLRFLEKNPKVHAEIYKNARRAVVRRFPYLIYYAIKGNRVQVASIIRSSRKSARWKKWFD